MTSIAKRPGRVAILIATGLSLLAAMALWAGPGTPPGNMESDAVAAHNTYRAAVKVPDIAWSAALAEHAEVHAKRLAKEHQFYHSKDRHGEGENLWMGTHGFYTYKQMVDSWGSEKKFFKYGTFPGVSTSGKWSDVGHYTQVIWKNTTEVGCALATGGGNDYFVCRYSPPGNYMGQKPY